MKLMNLIIKWTERMLLKYVAGSAKRNSLPIKNAKIRIARQILELIFAIFVTCGNRIPIKIFTIVFNVVFAEEERLMNSSIVIIATCALI